MLQTKCHPLWFLPSFTPLLFIYRNVLALCFMCVSYAFCLIGFVICMLVYLVRATEKALEPVIFLLSPQ
jgi:hypothetical protein